ncbi:uncharacterized protein LOC121384376 [Gigantopelta aegis]|uniref:uncharacterized protein LOC121384376 n=1 Tax=Gigantopelta aegis TaxID=1735272 RepID=UPI001B88A124|nr:uncharacterized protein LOC121384376 [Gigantopelta aegis]
MSTQAVWHHYSPPTQCGDGRCEDLFLDFLLTVVVPSGVGVLLAFSLAVFMCCSGSKRKRKHEADDPQFNRYDSVRRASLTLRQMSKKRDTPLMGNRSESMTLDRDHIYRRGFRPRDACQSAPGTLQRDKRRRGEQESTSSHPPPPDYRLPPDYLGHDGDDDAFVADNIPLQEMRTGANDVARRGVRNSAPVGYDDYMTR